MLLSYRVMECVGLPDKIEVLEIIVMLCCCTPVLLRSFSALSVTYIERGNYQHHTSKLPPKIIYVWCFSAHDFTFSSRVRGQFVPYGEAGDCYSTANCPQGRFSINLSGTGLRVSPYAGWVGQGNRPSLWLQRVSVRITQ